MRHVGFLHGILLLTACFRRFLGPSNTARFAFIAISPIPHLLSAWIITGVGRISGYVEFYQEYTLA